jgi:hypothetical protein
MALAIGGSAIVEEKLSAIGHEVPHPGQLVTSRFRVRLGAGDGLLELLAQR